MISKSNQNPRNKNSDQARVVTLEMVGLHFAKIFATYRCCLVFFMIFVVLSLSNPGKLNGQDTHILLSGPYLGQQPPGMVAQIFVPESLRSNSEWWWHHGVVFPSDGTEMFSDIYVGVANEGITIRYMEIINDTWTDPQRTNFDGEYAEASPTFLDNGNTMYFISNRPGGSYYGIWKTYRTDGIWSEPVAVSIDPGTNLSGGWEISVAADETMYLRMSDNSINTDLDIYMSEKSGGGYATPVRMSNNINSDEMDLAPFVAPDESYLIVASSRSGGYGGIDLYISFRDSTAEWTQVINMGSIINTSANEGAPSVSADGAYLFFQCDAQPHGRNPYWIDASIIESLNPLSIAQHDSQGVTPTVLGLNGCYPNPFNPTTTIKYELPQRSEVQITIYDLLGKQIETLASKTQEPGLHSIQWSAANVPSGMYFYQIRAGEFVQTRKMVLLK